MADYRRYFVAGGSYFFTVVTHNRTPLFASSTARTILGNVLRTCQTRWPFTIHAIVLLPDHLHAIWSLPAGDAAYPRRWAWIKKEFTKAWRATGGQEQPVTAARRCRNDGGVWQPRYWEHTIRDAEDFERHFDYIHYNPVRHGLAACPKDWAPSSFHRWVRNGVYESDWGCLARGKRSFHDIQHSAMEPP